MVKTILLFYYSTINNNTEILNSNSSNTSELSYHDFIDWLVGFTDGDGSFSIVKQGKTTFTFVYSIYLHKDDTPLQINIQKRLCMGKVYEGKHFSSFTITKKKEEVRKLISIFKDHPFNTSKNLNFSCWAEAFELYTNKIGVINVTPKILSLKNEMNKKRIKFIQPIGHTIKVSPYWFLGFVEAKQAGFFFSCKK